MADFEEISSTLETTDMEENSNKKLSGIRRALLISSVRNYKGR